MCGPFAGLASSSSGLVFDDTREKIVSCNNVAVTSGPCTSPTGLVKATLQKRVGQLKLIAQPAAGYSGLLLSTSGAGVKLEFSESSNDFWDVSFVKDFGGQPKYFTIGAGKYKVHADALPAHCAPVQSNDGVEVDVPEGGQVDLVVTYSPTLCSMKVIRASQSGATGTVTSTPAGLSCPASASAACTGTFAWGTSVTLTPVPDSPAYYNWMVGLGCVPGNMPCTQTQKSDSTYTVNFNVSSPPADAGAQDAAPSADAATPDASTPDASTLDASTTDADAPGADAAVPPAPTSPGTPENPPVPSSGSTVTPGENEAATAGKSDDGACATSPGATPWGHAVSAAIALAALGLFRRRRT